MMAKKKPKPKTKPKTKSNEVTQVSAQAYYPEGDARTLAEASAIKADKGRFSKAQKASAKLIKEQKAQLDGLEKVLKGL
jgi:hypothetical protein